MSGDPTAVGGGIAGAAVTAVLGWLGLRQRGKKDRDTKKEVTVASQAAYIESQVRLLLDQQQARIASLERENTEQAHALDDLRTRMARIESGQVAPAGFVVVPAVLFQAIRDAAPGVLPARPFPGEEPRT